MDILQKTKIIFTEHERLFTLSGAIILFFVILFTSLLLSNRKMNTSTSSTPQIHTPETIIHLTNNGFTPEKVKIAKGTPVRWVNTSSSDMASVNSDTYPTNRQYPELNLGLFKKNSTLVHVFYTAGIYTYHNQFNPKQTGLIQVE